MNEQHHIFIEENSLKNLSISNIKGSQQYLLKQGVREYSFLKLEDARRFAEQLMDAR